MVKQWFALAATNIGFGLALAEQICQTLASNSAKTKRTCLSKISQT
jgi:hypothetical protein